MYINDLISPLSLTLDVSISNDNGSIEYVLQLLPDIALIVSMSPYIRFLYSFDSKYFLYSTISIH